MYDERLAKIEQERQNAINQNNSIYNDLIKENETNYNLKNDLINQYETTQNDILDKQLKFNEEQIEKQKQEAQKNKETEERKARNDYMNYINPYGYQNENLVQNGLLNSGVYTKENLGAYTTYQNRLSSANKVLQSAFVDYDNQINEARANNDVQKAQNALAKLQQQISFADSFYSNKSNLTINQLQNNQNLDDSYYNRYQTEYTNIQNEKAAAQEQANWEKEYALSQAAANAKYYSGGSSSSSSSSSNNSYVLDDVVSGVDYENQKAGNGYTIIANPSTGTINEDAKYGVFNTGNGTGYQPNNISGIQLKKSGSVNENNKNIWIYDNGRTCQLVVWDGKQNRYVPYNGTLSSKILKQYQAKK